ncbi:hypothetical protein [uncultured Helicobacter sp.]
MRAIAQYRAESKDSKSLDSARYCAIAPINCIWQSLDEVFLK